jgi:hypothetical protein
MKITNQQQTFALNLFYISCMGPAEVAAWVLLGYIWPIVEFTSGKKQNAPSQSCVPGIPNSYSLIIPNCFLFTIRKTSAEGIASAGELRVWHYLGAGKPKKARSSGYRTIFVAYTVAVFGTSLLYMFSPHLVSWVTPDPTLQRMIYDAIPLVGISHIGLATSLVCWATLSAQGRCRLAMTVVWGGIWIVTIPLALIFVTVKRWNIQGLVAALIMGYTVSGVAQIALVLTSDWRRLSKKFEVEVSTSSPPEYSSSSSSSSSSGLSGSAASASGDESPISDSSLSASSCSIYNDESLCEASVALSSSSCYEDDPSIHRPGPDSTGDKSI